MVKATEAMGARARARKAKAELDARRAKAELDARRAEQDRLIVDAATAFYEGAEALTTARTAAAKADQQRVEAIANLVGLDQSVEQIATLCGIAVKEVRDLRRLAAATPPSKAQAAKADATPARSQAAEAETSADDGSAEETVPDRATVAA